MPTASSFRPLNLSARIPQLDGLRGLAILLVILCHYVGNPDHAPQTRVFSPLTPVQ